MIQIFVLYLAILGTDIASSVWSGAVPFIINAQQLAPSNAAGKPDFQPPASEIQSAVDSAASQIACVHENNRRYIRDYSELVKKAEDSSIALTGAINIDTVAIKADYESLNGSVYQYITYSDGAVMAGNDLNPTGCGQIAGFAVADTASKNPIVGMIADVHAQQRPLMYQQLFYDLAPMADPESEGMTTEGIEAAKLAAFNRYYGALKDAINNSGGAVDSAIAQMSRAIENDGWIGAGAMYIQAGAMKSAIKTAAANTGEASAGGKGGAEAARAGEPGMWRRMANDFMYHGFTGLAKSAYKEIGDALSPDFLAIQKDGFISWFVKRTPMGQLSIKDGLGHSGGNPIMAIKDFGDYVLNAVAITMAIITALAAVAIMGGPFSAGIAAFGSLLSATGVSTVLSLLLGSLFVVGVSMAVVIPMTPYILWTMGVIGWLILVFEAIVAAPIVAAGLVHPEGHDALGAAEPAKNLLMNVALRPTLMVFGMTGAIAISNAGAALVNATFVDTVNAVQTNTIQGLIETIAFICVYVAIQMTVVYKSFQMIHAVPEKIMRWIGGGHEQLGESEAASHATGIVAGGSRGVSGGMGAARVGGGKPGGGGEKPGGGGETPAGSDDKNLIPKDSAVKAEAMDALKNFIASDSNNGAAGGTPGGAGDGEGAGASDGKGASAGAGDGAGDGKGAAKPAGTGKKKAPAGKQRSGKATSAMLDMAKAVAKKNGVKVPDSTNFNTIREFLDDYSGSRLGQDPTLPEAEYDKIPDGFDDKDIVTKDK